PHRPVPPVPRRMRLGVDCRRGPDGVEVTPLRAQEIERVTAQLQRLRPDAVAIGLLHSPANPADEARLARAVRAALPDVPVTCSAELLPAYGEYERFCTAILNAAIGPVVGGYTRRLQAGIGRGQLRLLRSSLGIMSHDEAAAFPARAMFSGPAGGVLATMQLQRRLRVPRAAAFDMGGTSADVCLVEAGVAMPDAGTIGGLPLPLPTVPVHTVGCGGGSIAYVDAGGALRVGPNSAGADPGPACYGKGSEPTVTDAHLVLGHLGPDTLLRGAFPVDVDAAMRAIERLGRRLHLTPAATARGILTIADATMARAILVITAERAIDPATVPLVVYGGAGGLHAAGLMARLSMPSAVLPPHPGAFSALGLALAGDAVDCAEAVRALVDRRRLTHLFELGAKLLRTAKSMAPRGARGRVDVAVRYCGQGATLQLPLTRDLAHRFAREHQRRYGFITEAAIEVVRVTARAETPPRVFPDMNYLESSARAVTTRTRRAPAGRALLSVFDREQLRRGVIGPAIVEEATATTLIPAGYRASLTPCGLRLEVRA
ncbi:MAG: hydantoinase/oxoprolinase family protein, partial [Planctomycetota bacterium]